jgi:UDP-N-acetylmuramoyl-L-alanyl-D-glutamate--2,6-diaminopimelate ligase
MELDSLLRDLEVLDRSGPLPTQVAGVHYDSRQIEPGWAFTAIRGEVADGNDYVAQARARGASVILSERPASAGTPWVRVAQARQALAQASANWFGHPARRLRLVGITGTNGKTTTAFLTEAMLRQAGFPVGLLGTIAYHIGETVLSSPHTTPESRDLQALLARMVEAGCSHAVMEVSSHALAMDRVWSCHFSVAVFTNLTQDHLDFHGSMAAYAAAKRRLFTGTGAAAPEAAVVNADDPATAEMIRGYRGRLLSYGFGPEAELRASGIEYRPSGLSFTLQGPGGLTRRIASPLLGRVNVLNLLAAVGVGLALGLDCDAVLEGLPHWPPVKGRFERVDRGQPFTVVVDYAHTPDALAHVLALARELTQGRVLVVFGCGGDRDRSKRPLMGRAAQAGSDWALVTSDNPRSEDPAAIIAEIRSGMAPDAASEPDRRAAIRLALGQAGAGDTVVIAGKGHEDYQIIGAERLPFDDAEEARAALTALGWTA